ncbi:pentatricopeptide repeat-containing protein At2g13600 isoform X2 [Cryptomeria japonica]|uniref:pentatricopeptide repeat-containing protein At2g13600 isoform X2 n=1 Tax=Cryptomeria japonica TaxID=3369 RepID=UPI0027DA3B53|nr:pentatricopeptide repeat-containing protein At2g13600 isoform X2 [Cryptomeria japonica]
MIKRFFVSSLSETPKKFAKPLRVLKQHIQHLQRVKQNLNTVTRIGKTENAKEKRMGFLENLPFGKLSENLHKLCEDEQLKEALDVVLRMDKFETRLDRHAYVLLLKVCGNLRALAEGKIVHAHMILSGIEEESFGYNKLVIMYVKCWSLDFARQVFDKMPKRDVVSETALIAGYAQSGRSKDARQVFDQMLERNVISWNAMIAGYGRAGYGVEAIKLFNHMGVGGVKANHFTLSNVIGICGGLKALEHGLQVHGQIIKMGFESGVAVGNALIDMYAKCGNVDAACSVFGNMHDQDVVSWTAMIAGYAQNDRIDDARQLFDRMFEKNVVSWNAMIAGYIQNGLDEEALSLFEEMQRNGKKPNQSTCVSILKACASLIDLRKGNQVHGYIIKMGYDSDVHVGSTLIDLYAKGRTLNDACKVFDTMPARNTVTWSVMVTGYLQHRNIDDAEQLFHKMPERNVVSWNAMIAGSAQNGLVDVTLKHFIQMQCEGIEPDESTFSSVISVCANSYALEQGKRVHALIINKKFDSYLSVGNSLITMYAKNGKIDDACKVFNRMSKQDVVSWTAMITGYAENGRTEEAQLLFDRMPIRNVVTGNAMITAYLHNGRMGDAIQVFSNMPNRNLITWNAMTAVYACEEALGIFFQMHQAAVTPDQSTFSGILGVCANLAALEKGYAQHGSGNKALRLFEHMQQLGVKPNDITFINVLTACSHAGLVIEGWHYFHCMSQDYQISPTAYHYACMIDLLGRAGHLDEAKNLICNMPCEADAVVWGALLGACKIHANMELGKFAAEHLFVLEPQNAAAYVALSNLCAMVNRWDEVAKVRILMRQRGIKKKPGCSWIEIKNRVHTFIVGDRSHSQTEKIYALLASLHRQMKAAGYVPDVFSLAHDVE